MQNEPSLILIDLTPEYKKNLRNLSKRYRNIRSDTQPVIAEIQKGNFIGDRLFWLNSLFRIAPHQFGM